MEGILWLLSSRGALLLFIILFLLITAFIFKFAARRIARIYCVVCLCFYGYLLAYVTLLSRTPILETRINLVPFQAADGMTGWDSFANIAMFIPFPILLYGINPRKRSIFAIAGTGLGLSFLIEAIQYFSHRGICDIDDFILNSIGVILGALISIVFANSIMRNKSEEFKSN